MVIYEGLEEIISVVQQGSQLESSFAHPFSLMDIKRGEGSFLQQNVSRKLENVPKKLKRST